MEGSIEKPMPLEEEFEQCFANSVKLKQAQLLAEYMDLLQTIKDGYMTIMATQYEWQKSFTPDIARQVQRLGVTADFSKAPDSNHVVVLIDGKPAFEEAGIKDKALSLKQKLGDTVLDVVSVPALAMPPKAPAKIGISLNGKTLTYNKRGLSIVVYDYRTDTVIDAVTFDTCLQDCPAFRAEQYCNDLIEAISELHVGFGYTIAQWLYDNGFKNISLLLEPQFADLAKAVALSIKMNEGITVDHYFVNAKKTSFSLRYQQNTQFIKERYLPLDLTLLEPKDTVVYMSPFTNRYLEKSARKTGAQFFYLKELVSFALSYMKAEEAVLKLVAEAPGTHAFSYTLPLFNRDESEYAQTIRANKITRAVDLEALRRGEPYGRISPYIEESKSFSNADWLELICYPNPEAYNDENGFRVLKDKKGKFVNIANGHRVTAFHPKDYSNTIYIFGGCNAFGIYCTDEQTFSSQLQKVLNENASMWGKYKVENYSHFLFGHYVDIARVIASVRLAAGDIVIFPSRKSKFSQFSCLDFNDLTYPTNYGCLYVDAGDGRTVGQLSPNMHRFIAEKMYELLVENEFFQNEPTDYHYTTRQIPLCGLQQKAADNNLPAEFKNGLEKYKAGLRVIQQQEIGRIGSIVMNCNPFTLGHRYLAEYAASKVKHLFIFVVEEDKSVFPFKDRLELVKEGTRNLPNVTVLPSGRFIVSSLTFTEYFQKSSIQDRVVDPSDDVTLFARETAPTLGISIRFAGEEPLDNITLQYNNTMQEILPRYGIEFEVIPRKKSGKEVISASRVRRLLCDEDFDAIAKLVPKTTLSYLVQNYGGSTKASRLINQARSRIKQSGGIDA